MGHRPGKPGAPARQPSPLAAGAPGRHRPLLPSPPPGTFPICGVWDVTEWSGPYWYHFGETHRWAQQHIPSTADTWRAEFIIADGIPAAIAHRYATDTDGCHYFDTHTGSPACAEPVIIALAELPDPHLFSCPAPDGRFCAQCSVGGVIGVLGRGPLSLRSPAVQYLPDVVPWPGG